MLIRYAMLAIACFASGVAISGGYFAFISMIGIFPKLLEKVKGARYYLLIECLLAYGAALANLIYVFKISVPVTWVGYTIICLFGGIFVGCLAGALTEVLNVIPIAAKIQCEKKSPLCHIRPCRGKTGGLGAECRSGHVIKSKLFCVKWRYLL